MRGLHPAQKTQEPPQHPKVSGGCLSPQDPTACSAWSVPGVSVPPASGCTNWPRQLPRPNNQCSTNEQAAPGHSPEKQPMDAQSKTGRQLLLRKEVIQPHLPVRLPCYDFVPIAGPTFDGSLPKGLGHRLRVLPTFVV